MDGATNLLTTTLQALNHTLQAAEFLFNPLHEDATIFTYIIDIGVGGTVGFWVLRKVFGLAMGFFSRGRRAAA